MMIHRLQQARAFHQEGRLDDARLLCEQILRETSGGFEVLALLALIAAQRGDFEGAIAHYADVVAIKPDFADAYANRGASFAALNRHNEALTNFDQAIAIDSAHVGAHLGRAIVWLQQGDFARGWREFEWRWKTPEGAAMRARKGLARPLWLGAENIAGKTLLIHAEKGLGDTLQFCRFATSVAGLGAAVLLQVQEPLVEVLQHMDGVSQVIADTRPAPPCDMHCPLLSLPLALNIELPGISGVKYLRTPAARVARWRAKFGERSMPLIGLVWRGDPKNAIDHARSIALERLFSELPRRYRYVSLQQNLTESEQRFAAAHCSDLSLSENLSFADTAALCGCLDLVISVDTSIAHLSAALGRKTWILLPFNADCRWLMDRGDSPWYQSAALFRQAHRGGWSDVLKRVGVALNQQFG